LLDTDAFVREVSRAPSSSGPWARIDFITASADNVSERGANSALKDSSVLAAAYECGVPVFTSIPGQFHRHERGGHGHARFSAGLPM